MISDVLFDAAHKIKQYQRDFPGSYRDLEPQINDVLRVMDRLRVYLDTAPAVNVVPPSTLTLADASGIN